MHALTFGDSDGLDTFAAALEYLISNDHDSAKHPWVAEIEFTDWGPNFPSLPGGKYGLSDFLDGDDENPTKVLLRPYDADANTFGPMSQASWVPLLDIATIFIP